MVNQPKKNILTKQLLCQFMHDELAAIVYYQQLITMTTDKENRALLTHIMKEEERHLCYFETLYNRMFNKFPDMPQAPAPYIRYFVEGVKTAFLDEMNAYEEYRDLYLRCCQPKLKAIFFEAMTDENRHALALNFMYSKYLEKQCTQTPVTQLLHTPTEKTKTSVALTQKENEKAHAMTPPHVNLPKAENPPEAGKVEKAESPPTLAKAEKSEKPPTVAKVEKEEKAENKAAAPHAAKIDAANEPIVIEKIENKAESTLEVKPAKKFEFPKFEDLVLTPKEFHLSNGKLKK